MADSKYEWDLSLLYKSESDRQDDLQKFHKLAEEIKSLEGKLNNKQSIVTYLKKSEDLMRVLSRLNLFAMMKIDKDSRVAKSLKQGDEITNLITRYSVDTAFVQPELAKNSDEFLLELQRDPELKDYARFFESIIREKKHTISKEKEALMAGMMSFTDFREIFDKLADVEIKFEDITTKTGERLALNNATYGLYSKSEDAEIRRQAHKNLHEGYSKFNLTLSDTYLSYLKKSDFVSKTYNFPSTFDKALFREEVSKSIYDKLIENVHKFLPLYQEYYKAKAKAIGKKDFLISDVYAPVGDGSRLNLDYDDAVKVVLDMVKVLGPEYYDVSSKAFSSRWVDVFPSEGKRGGAYSVSAQTGNPFMLLNHNKTYASLSTIAHELGHSLHSYFSEKNQPYYTQDYVIFVAEVASTVNEVLLAKKLMRETNNIEEKKFIAENLLSEFSASVFRQAMFSEFEYFAHNEINKGNSLSFEELNEKYAGLQKQYFGNAVKVHEFAKFEWSRIPHFYTAFYVYKYATGFISAVTIAQNIEKFGKEYVENNYIKFLSAGSCTDPISILKMAAVDITSDKPYETAFQYYKELVEIIKN